MYSVSGRLRIIRQGGSDGLVGELLKYGGVGMERRFLVSFGVRR